MGVMDEAPVVAPRSAAAWGKWLREHHASSAGVWLRVDDRKAPGAEALSYENAVLEGLCWGWIDAQAKVSADGASLLWFSRRRPGSPWAATNKRRIDLLEATDRLQPPGRALVEAARADGSWTLLDGPEAGIEPSELAGALDAAPAARQHWDAFPPSARKQGLTQVALARRPETRARRIAKLVADAERDVRPS